MSDCEPLLVFSRVTFSTPEEKKAHEAQCVVLPESVLAVALPLAKVQTTLANRLGRLGPTLSS